MKKNYLLLTAFFLLFFSCSKVTAQAPYKASVGGILYPSIIAAGPSCKFFFTDHVAFQADFFVKGVFTVGIDANTNKISFAPYLSIENNTNFYYQKKLKEKTFFDLFWFAGGGISLGYSFTSVCGKFGANTILGLEYVFKKKPLVIQIDFRPGYGLLFNSNDSPIIAIFFTHKNPWSHFDWLIGFTIRHILSKKCI